MGDDAEDVEGESEDVCDEGEDVEDVESEFVDPGSDFDSDSDFGGSGSPDVEDFSAGAKCPEFEVVDDRVDDVPDPVVVDDLYASVRHDCKDFYLHFTL